MKSPFIYKFILNANIVQIYWTIVVASDNFVEASLNFTVSLINITLYLACKRHFSQTFVSPFTIGLVTDKKLVVYGLWKKWTLIIFQATDSRDGLEIVGDILRKWEKRIILCHRESSPSNKGEHVFDCLCGSKCRTSGLSAGESGFELVPHTIGTSCSLTVNSAYSKFSVITNKF